MTRAERMAQEIRTRTGQGVPVDVGRIATDYSLVVVWQSMEETVSGMLVVHDAGGTIGINQDHPTNRQRFSIAHEIGHYLLHRNDERVFVDAAPIFYRDQSSSDGSKTREIEANQFAAELLMPRDVLIEYLEKDHHFDPADDVALRRLASRFGVSPQAMLIRLMRLDLIAG